MTTPRTIPISVRVPSQVLLAAPPPAELRKLILEAIKELVGPVSGTPAPAAPVQKMQKRGTSRRRLITARVPEELLDPAVSVTEQVVEGLRLLKAQKAPRPRLPPALRALRK